MPRLGFELTKPVFERAKTVHAWDRAAGHCHGQSIQYAGRESDNVATVCRAVSKPFFRRKWKVLTCILYVEPAVRSLRACVTCIRIVTEYWNGGDATSFKKVMRLINILLSSPRFPDYHCGWNTTGSVNMSGVTARWIRACVSWRRYDVTVAITFARGDAIILQWHCKA
jgi:hypothetical protein